MRIGILTHNYPRSSNEQVGAEVFIYWFAHLLQKKGHDVFVFCPNFKGKKDKDKKVHTTWFKWYGGNKKLGNLSLTNPIELILISLMMIKGSFEVLKFVDENKIDITISMWGFPAGFWSMIAKFLKRKPSVVISMGSDVFVYPKILPAKWLIGFIFKHTDFIYGNGYKICEEIKRISGRKALFFPIAADKLPLKNARKIKMDKNKFNFIYIGRLENVKGVDILLEAAKILKEKTDKFDIYLAGPGTMYDFLKDTSTKYNLSNNFYLLGGVYDRKKVAGLFLGADALVMASRSESTPFTVIESVFASLPMVVTDVGDMGKICRDFKLGYVVTPRDPGKLADAMYEAILEGKNFKKKRAKNFLKPQQIYNSEMSTDLLLARIEKELI
jgi:glycosyltransferase involved in cell wall biosynthesis